LAKYVPSGHVLYLRRSALVAQPFDVNAARFTGEPTVLGENVGADVWGLGSFSAANDVLLHRGGPAGNDTRLLWRERSGSGGEAVADAALYRTFDLSRDERQLVTHVHDERSLAGNLWLIDVARRTTSRLTEVQQRHCFRSTSALVKMERTISGPCAMAAGSWCSKGPATNRAWLRSSSIGARSSIGGEFRSLSS
jgi:hypothetical protein